MQPKTLRQRIHLGDDESLLRRIQRRDETALEELYDRQSTAVYSLALRIVGDRAAAEDVLSDVFWRVWRRAETFDPRRGSPTAWLLTITRRRALDELRMGARRERRERSPDAMGEVPQERAPSPEDEALAGEVQEHVREALSALPPEQRGPIELAYFEGLTHVEIADRLQEPLGTIKTRIRAGMQRLRESLMAYFGQMQ